MIKVGVIADTHNILLPQVISNLSDCDYIIHAGDVSNGTILEALKTIAPTLVVRGNKDSNSLQLPESLTINLGSFRIYIIHRYQDIPKNITNIDIIIYGHSHKYEVFSKDNIQYFNPGGCGRRRFSLPLTMGYLYITETSYTIEKICL